MSGARVLPRGTCRTAGTEDIPACAAIYLNGFERGLRSLFGRLPRVALLEDVLFVYLAAEPEGFLIWESEGCVGGYLLVTRSLGRLVRRVLLSGYVLRMCAHLLRGMYGIAKPHVLARALRECVAFGLHSGHYRTSGDAQIVSIAVREGTRGAGVGRELMRAGFAYLESARVREVRLEVQPDNPAAQRLYERIGFATVGEVPSPLGRAIVMTCPVPPRTPPAAGQAPA
jgi:ribosomal protein S18 acetylase RimI-like enzyme